MVIVALVGRSLSRPFPHGREVSEPSFPLLFSFHSVRLKRCQTETQVAAGRTKTCLWSSAIRPLICVQPPGVIPRRSGVPLHRSHPWNLTPRYKDHDAISRHSGDYDAARGAQRLQYRSTRRSPGCNSQGNLFLPTSFLRAGASWLPILGYAAQPSRLRGAGGGVRTLCGMKLVDEHVLSSHR